ncbi:MAG: heme A synthase [Alphaproteobacteria bacterium]|nr:heme A synthase [Alphaproteobacteria bacterium]
MAYELRAAALQREGAPFSVAVWLFVCAGMVMAMMMIGAITRLTESGLSMVEWRPLIGAWPPTSEAEWQRVFDLYRQTSEYQLANAGMALAEFKTIFWWEFIHRLWGRLIGVVFAMPFVAFLILKKIPRSMTPHLVALFVLGGLQGLIGWWMVKSGFVDRIDVSQYRLTVHLGIAFGILGYLLWLALDIVAPRGSPASDGLRRRGWLTLGVLSATVLAGGLVAGSHAGLTYNTWPLMDGAIVPEGIFDLSPWWLNGFENIATIQFDHRMLAYISLGSILWLWLGVRWAHTSPLARLAAGALAAMALVQVILGVATLLMVVPLPLAVLHQAGAATLFALAVWTVHALSGRG